VYSDFYEIPLPALRFEKVEEYLTKVNDTEENDARPRQKQISNVKKDDTRRSSQQRNAESATSKRHARNTNTSENNETQTEKERQ
jgi:hypothetical protein